jgi:hypothetical protein
MGSWLLFTSNNRARNGYFAESATTPPNTRARNGYFAESVARSTFTSD